MAPIFIWVVLCFVPSSRRGPSRPRAPISPLGILRRDCVWQLLGRALRLFRSLYLCKGALCCGPPTWGGEEEGAGGDPLCLGFFDKGLP